MDIPALPLDVACTSIQISGTPLRMLHCCKCVGTCNLQWHVWRREDTFPRIPFSTNDSVEIGRFYYYFHLHALVDYTADSFAASNHSSFPSPPVDSGSISEDVTVPYAITSVSWAPSCGHSYHLVATGGRDGHLCV
ncbi:hypothetical protein BJV74DRAFT_546748 [Russula compacta]|nr:hypothetical protein BJV74DRAFT_546748 [Russula compacta]